MIGTIAIMRPVAAMPTSSWWLPVKCMIPSGSVRLSSSVNSTTANRNSFQRMMKLSITVVKIAGAPIGTVTRQKISKSEYPSIRGVEQVLRNLREEALEDVDGDGDVRGHVDEDEPRQRV